MGRGVVSLLAGNGVQCVIPWRGDDMEWRHLKVMGDIGVVAPMPFSPRDEASIDRAMEGCDIVVNLIGKDFETKHFVPNLVNFSYEEVHVTLAERLAKKAVQHGASTFVTGYPMPHRLVTGFPMPHRLTPKGDARVDTE